MHQAAALSILLCLVILSTAHADNGYTVGRATFYTDNQEGSCRYGRPDNVYYAAWPDTQAGAPACGSCFEVMCVNRDFSDGYGQRVSRSSACFDESKRIVVKVIDSCPCVHPNYYSNQRWCCGDAPHMDLSQDVFKMLADEHYGVIGLQWKPASCDQLGVIMIGSVSQADKGDSGGSSQQDANKDHQLSSWDTDWIKKKVSSWGGLNDQQFEQRWKDTTQDTWASKYKWEKPGWVKSMFSGGNWRR